MERKYTQKELRGLHLRRFYFLFLTFTICSIFYYFGEIVDFLGWEVLRFSFFYSVHDIHRLVFLLPILYAAYHFGMKATIIIIILMVCIFMPRALFISPYPDPTIRVALFSIIAVVAGLFTAVMSEHRIKTERYIKRTKEQYLRALDEVEDGVLLIGPDYRIRFLNERMKQRFGDGVSSYCYNYLHNKSAPCRQICRLSNVQEGVTAETQYEFSCGRRCKVVALPYIDTDGVTCQLSIIKNITNELTSPPQT